MKDDHVLPPDDDSFATPLSLLGRARIGDRLAWDDLVRIYGPLVRRWCRAKGLQDADALDIGQTVFCKVLKNLELFRKEDPSHSFRRWLKTVASNAIVDHFRGLAKQVPAEGGSSANQRLQELADDEVGEQEEADENSKSEELKVVHARILELLNDQFEPKTLELYRRIRIERQSSKDAAEAVGVSVTAAYIAVSRVRKKILKVLEGLEDEKELGMEAP